MSLPEQPITPEQPTIMVGFDGSAGSRAALEWAVAEAAVRGARLVVVQAWTPGEFGTEEDLESFTRDRASRTTAEAVGERAIHWEVEAPRGTAGKVLVEKAKGADMLVVGSRGHGTVSSVLLGSVSVHVSTHAEVPAVVIVRP